MNAALGSGKAGADGQHGWVRDRPQRRPDLDRAQHKHDPLRGRPLPTLQLQCFQSGLICRISTIRHQLFELTAPLEAGI